MPSEPRQSSPAKAGRKTVDGSISIQRSAVLTKNKEITEKIVNRGVDSAAL